MTYQRNMGAMGLLSEKPLNDGVPNRVEEPQIGPGDDHEPHRHGRALADLSAVGPLDAAQLEVGGAQEVGGAAEQALARGPRVLALGVRLAPAGDRAVAAGPAWRRARLGEMSLRHVGHRLPERVGRLRFAEVTLQVVVAYAIALAGAGVGLRSAA